MKTILKLIFAAVCIITVAGCGSLDYKKMKTGVVYKIFPGDSKDSLPVMTNVVKFNIVRKFNDSVVYDSHDKMPVFIQLNNPPEMDYNPFDMLYYVRKGDSAIVIEMVDTLIKKGYGSQLPPNAKKGDRIMNYIRILEVYRADSIARKDYEEAMAKDRPRQEKEMKEMQAKAAKEREEERKKDMEELKKSGELERQIKEVEAYLTAKKINAVKTELGTFVVVNQKGSGEAVTDGKHLAIKYTGRLMPSDSVFQSSSLVFQLGTGEMIPGFEDGLKLFNENGKGILYLPGYMGYGKSVGPGGKPYQPMIFDVEVLKVADSQDKAYAAKQVADSIDAAKNKAAEKK